jgi:hypothetical protein
VSSFATDSASKGVHLILFYRDQSILKRLLLLKELEGALLGNIARLLELAERLEARGVLLLGHNATLLGLHEILLGQPTGSVLGRSVPDLGLGASSNHSAAILLILASIHFYIQCGEYILEHGKSWNPSS